MWTKGDFLRMVIVAAATCGLSTGVLWHGSATAQQAVARPAAELPTLKVGAWSAKGAAVKDDATVEITGVMATVPAGAIPRAKLTVINESDAPESVQFTAAFTISTFKDMLSRRPRVISPSWTKDYAFTLQARETREIDVDPGVVLPDQSIGSLMVKHDKQAVNVVSFTTPRAAKPAATK